MAKFSRLFEKIIIAPPALTCGEDQRRARTLQVIVLVQALAQLSFAFIMLFDNAGAIPEVAFSVEQFAVSLLIIVPAYLLARTRFYVYGGAWLITGFIVNMLAIITATQLEHPDHGLVFLSIVTFIAALTLPMVVAIGIAFITSMTIAVIPFFTPYSLELIMPTLMFHTSMSALILAGAALQRRSMYNLELSQKRFKDLMEANLESIAVHDNHGTIIDVNPALERLIGLPREALINRSILEFVPEWASEAVDELLEYDGETYEVEAFNAQGEARIIEGRTHRQQWHGEDAYVTLVNDITERKQLERQRIEIERRYRALFDQTADAVIIVDMQSRIIEVNQRASDMLGYDLDELIHRDTTLILHWDEHGSRLSVVEKLLNDEIVPVFERHFVRKDGTLFIGEVNATVVRDVDRKPLYFQNIIRDTSARRAEQARQFELALQGEKIKMLEDFIGETSHYFRTPLTNLKTSLYLLSRHTDKPEKQTYHRQVIEDEIKRLEQLLEDMLTITRLQRGDEASLTHFNIARNLKEIVDLLQRKNSTHILKLHHKDTDDQAYQILGDFQRVMQAFSNLIENAIQYSDAGSEINIIFHHIGEWIAIQVRDQGIGIAAEDIPHIYTSFYRADNARAIDSASSGLGLAITEKVITMHRGMIHVDSEPGKGTTFSVVLPVASNWDRANEKTAGHILAAIGDHVDA